MLDVEKDGIKVRVSEWDVIIEAERGKTRYYGHIILQVPVMPKIIVQEFRNNVLRLTLYRLSSGLYGG
ncbi:MAG: hypothetical protein QXH24_05520 [Candidatus Bathyarchaeia archaeon]